MLQGICLLNMHQGSVKTQRVNQQILFFFFSLPFYLAHLLRGMRTPGRCAAVPPDQGHKCFTHRQDVQRTHLHDDDAHVPRQPGPSTLEISSFQMDDRSGWISCGCCLGWHTFQEGHALIKVVPKCPWVKSSGLIPPDDWADSVWLCARTCL